MKLTQREAHKLLRVMLHQLYQSKQEQVVTLLSDPDCPHCLGTGFVHPTSIGDDFDIAPGAGPEAIACECTVVAWVRTISERTPGT